MPEFKDKVSHHVELLFITSANATLAFNSVKDWIDLYKKNEQATPTTAILDVKDIIFFERFKRSGKKNFKKWLRKELSMLEKMLIEKNEKYGNSALKPLRIFSSSDSVEQINVRMDDKLSRIYNQKDTDDEDAELDFLGYFILREIALTCPSSLFYR